MSTIFTTIRPESPQDREAIHAIHCQSFGHELEANLVNELRNEGFSFLSLVAEVEGDIAGHILFSPLQIVSAERTIRAVSLAPVAVLPARQRQGIGSTLIRTGLDNLRRRGEQIVIVLGEPAYYERFGFSTRMAAPLQSSYPSEYFMALELLPGSLTGISGEVRYAAPFARLG